MSELIYVTAIATPAEGKLERYKVKELFVDLAKTVKANEPGVLKYEFFEQTNGENGKNTIIVHEIYKDRATFEAHMATPEFAAAAEKVEVEGLLEGGLDIREAKPFAGYVR